MSELYEVDPICLRYIVPFQYMGTFSETCSKVEAQKEEIYKKIEDPEDSDIQEEKAEQDKKKKRKKVKVPTGTYKKTWERCNASIEGPESDLYDYIKNEFKFDDETEPVQKEKAGCEWLFEKNVKTKKAHNPIKELQFFPKGISKDVHELPEGWKVDITGVGLYLFRNGLGFVWYELAIRQKLTVDQLKQFQYEICELNRNEKTKIWERSVHKPTQGFQIRMKDSTIYYSPFSFGYWITMDMLGFLDIRYLAERKSAYAHMIKESMNNCSGMLGENIAVWTDEQKDKLKDDCADTEKKEYRVAPDKAILFLYAAIRSNHEGTSLLEWKKISYHLTNGYKDPYMFSEEHVSEIKRPFENVLWYATQEGASYLVWPQKDNENFFYSVFPNKAKSDYFTLYMKILYQSFSLMVYAKRIHNEISAVNEEDPEDGMDESITKLFEEINIFLAKGMATSVSYIHHQSQFYIYLKEQLRIRDDVESVTAGLKALDAVQRERRQRKEWADEQKRDRQEEERNRKEQEEREKYEAKEKKRDNQLQAIMGVFGLLAIFSAFEDGFQFCRDVVDLEVWSGLKPVTFILEMVVLAVILVISCLEVFFAVRAFRDAFKKDQGLVNYKTRKKSDDEGE